MFGTFILWGPAVISIAVALSVAALTRSARIPLWAKLDIGLAFEIAGSYGIAGRGRRGPAGVTLPKQLQEVDLATEQDLRKMMLVNVHDACSLDELSNRFSHCALRSWRHAARVKCRPSRAGVSGEPGQ